MVPSSRNSKRRLVKSKEHFKFFNLSKSKRLTNLQKKQLKNIFLPVCMLYMQLASMNVFVPCDKWNTLFLSLSLLWDFFNRYIVVFLETNVLKELCALSYLRKFPQRVLRANWGKLCILYEYFNLRVVQLRSKNRFTSIYFLQILTKPCRAPLIR